MEQKIEFINEWISGRSTITELCRHFDITRPTAYKWVGRLEEKGLEGLELTPRADLSLLQKDYTGKI